MLYLRFILNSERKQYVVVVFADILALSAVAVIMQVESAQCIFTIRSSPAASTDQTPDSGHQTVEEQPTSSRKYSEEFTILFIYLSIFIFASSLCQWN